MKLHCTLVRGPHAPSPGPPLELTVEAPQGCAGTELQHALERQFGAGDLSVSGQPLSCLVLGVPPLATGAVIVDGAGGRTSRIGAEDSASLLVAVHSGPAAGTVLPLRRGTYRIGRSGTDIALPDPAVSREHARLDVTDTAVTIADLDSVNGSFVDGKRVAQGEVSTDSVISCGSSTLSVVFGPRPAGRPLEWDAAGASVTEPLTIPHRPEGGNRGLLLLTAVLPLLIGVGLAVVTGMWMFLAFTAVSAVSMLVPLIAGRRQRRRLKSLLAAAVHEDRERRRRSAPSAAELALRGQTPPAGRSAGPAAPDEIALRLGLAEQVANIRLDPVDPDFEAPAAGLMPFILQLSGIAFVRGPKQDVAGLVRFMIMQLTSYRSAARTRILVHGPPCTLPLSARYLAPVVLSSNAQTTLALLERGIDRTQERGILVLTGSGDEPAEAPDLSDTAVGRGWQVLDCTLDGPAESGEVIELRGAIARLCNTDSAKDFLPDLVPEGVFDQYCRSMALQRECSPQAEPVVPQNCSLAEVLPWSAADVSARWLAGDLRPGLSVPIGMAAQGPRTLDLESDGPHLLVAGTTGSGKSELLRSLAAGLALSYPPSRINFLFFDFKGGSGLGPLTGLPHCVGMLTDLTRSELDRALSSLRAEIRYREEVLSAAQASDLEDYRAAGSPAGPLAHLVLVIDEFRMLVEDAPEALKELMRIAAIGRSLGIHLVMATQRPQGALTADIRANVTSSIALRVQSEMESVDIINSRVAAGIGVGSPGRAYLARGTEDPVEFQTASLAGASAAGNTSAVRVRLAAEASGTSAPDDDGQYAGRPTSPAEAAGPLVESLVNLWDGMGCVAPRRPVAPPLPAQVALPKTAATCGSTPGAWTVEMGLIDEPDRQRVSPLTWLPSDHGHLGFIGSTGSGVDEALDLALQQLIGHDVESHVYLLDAGNLLSSADSQPRVGAAAGPHELRRAVRILERIALEMSLRLNRPAKEVAPPIVLVLGGWGSWVSSLRAGPLAWAEDLVQDIVRDGAKAGVTVLIAGDREVVTARFFASVPNRAYFPTGSTDEGRLAWPRLPDVTRLRGRAVVFGPLTGSAGSVAQFYDPPPTGWADAALVKEPAVRPFRIEALPTRIGAPEVLARIECHSASSGGTAAALRGGNKNRKIIVGIGGDELIPAAVRLQPATILPVLGGPASGKSSLLTTIPLLNPDVSGWLFPGPEDDVASYWAEVMARADAGRLDKDSILLVDDADMLSLEAGRHLAALHGLGLTGILTAGFSPSLAQRVPLAAQARGQGNGILIAPRTMLDGDFFGVRFEVEPNPPAGRAVLIAEGRGTAVQLAAPGLPITAPGAPRRRAKQI
ncbi:FtsK/SpoIIIE domain-containing protein [Arthrobacter oryzae]|uniref:FtsK/SpoIIIE domain-containing protein n=1 Tax=Arthrobacter oryzae TaxID=409290 RepID=UPI00273AFDF1|nr:FtsK/SpoIIIE domain-containing protein [Arthrobacter oryzae]WLQ06645.1 FtsK/SpoIIIE domain-containing protein [Arthrobacter oryzae]